MSNAELEPQPRREDAVRSLPHGDIGLRDPIVGGRRRLPPVFAWLAAVVLIVGTAAALAVLRNTDADRGRHPDGSIDIASRTHISGLVNAFERETGGGEVARVEAVRSTRSRAVETTMDDTVPGKEPVWVVQLIAATQFHPITTGPPRSQKPAAVRYEIWVLDATTVQSDDGSVGNAHVDLSALGPVTSFEP